MKNYLLSCVAVILYTTISFNARAQQDPLYNQYFFNQAIINPGYTGTYNVTNAMLLTRAQWRGIEGAPTTHILNVTTSMRNETLGAGLLVVNDRLGINNNVEAQASFAYKLNLNDYVLAFGMQAGVIHYRYDYTKLNLEVVDQELVAQTENVTKPTIGTGIFIRNHKFFAGLSVPRLLQVKVEDGVSSSTRYKRHYYGSIGYIIDRYGAIKIKPSALVRYIEGERLSIDLNGSVLLTEALWAGISFRDFRTLCVNAQFEIKDKFRFGYLYELPDGRLISNTYGTHELMLSADLEIFSKQLALRRYF
jgi:type IX secretion system PorP/SprF family membrane protein